MTRSERFVSEGVRLCGWDRRRELEPVVVVVARASTHQLNKAAAIRGPGAGQHWRGAASSRELIAT